MPNLAPTEVSPRVLRTLTLASRRIGFIVAGAVLEEFMNSRAPPLVQPRDSFTVLRKLTNWAHPCRATKPIRKMMREAPRPLERIWLLNQAIPGHSLDKVPLGLGEFA